MTINVHPIDQSLKNLKRELTKNYASIPTVIGGGGNGHAGIVTKKGKYISVLEGGIEFTIMSHPRY